MGYHKLYSVSRANSVIVCTLHLKRHATCMTFRVVQSCLPDGVACFCGCRRRFQYDQYIDPYQLSVAGILSIKPVRRVLWKSLE